MKKMMMVLFAVMCLAQWIVPGKMVYDSENTIAEGTLYKFKTAPVDPSDPLRGKYITLNFQENFFQFADSAEWQRGDQIFVTFTTDSAGFAVPEQVYHTTPEAASYLETVVEHVNYYRMTITKCGTNSIRSILHGGIQSPASRTTLLESTTRQRSGSLCFGKHRPGSGGSSRCYHQ